MSNQKQFQLFVERSDGELWGRIKVRGNLIVASAKTLESLKKELSKLALDFEQVEIMSFEVSYDLTSFFENYTYLNISELASRAGISPSLMRQYVSGSKFASEQRVKEIESAIHKIGKELSRVRIVKSKMKTPPIGKKLKITQKTTKQLT